MTSMIAHSLFPLTISLIVLLLLRKYLLSRMGALFCYQMWALVPLLLGVTLLPINNMFIAEVNTNNPFYQVTLLPSVVPTFDGTNWFLIVWIIGVSIVLSMMIVSHLLFHLRISPSLSPLRLKQRVDETVENELLIFKSEKVTGPMLLGFIKPKLILPANFESIYNPSQQALIIAHERHHYARGDIFWNLCALVLTSVYWFHPLSWFALRKFKQDQELSCDYAVLLDKTTFDKQQYAHALVNTFERQPVFVTHLTFGNHGAKNMIRERINQINAAKPYKKFTTLALFVGFFTLISLLSACTKNPPQFESLTTNEKFFIEAERVEVNSQTGINRYFGNVIIQIPNGQMTEIQSNSQTVGNGLNTFEGDVKVTTSHFEISLNTMSVKTTAESIQLTSSYAELKTID
ncbi:M56 family metallopeptidase [Glaciecola sp. MF2-115]|uniref:M56 family metallopeptidase n=1 Tax=Glaciecola sp. MF2-115 TaxID=3384827 RepID=UPI00399F1301